MKKEVWKDIPDYEGFYQVSNLGKVKSVKRIVVCKTGRKLTVKERILKQGLSKGYLMVVLNKNNKGECVKVHILVAMAFLNHKRCGHKWVVDHKNNIRTDNRLENLQITTNRHNASKDRNGYTSDYVGVCWHKAAKKWLCQIHHKGERIYLGLYNSEYKAHLAYQAELKKIV